MTININMIVSSEASTAKEPRLAQSESMLDHSPKSEAYQLAHENNAFTK